MTTDLHGHESGMPSKRVLLRAQPTEKFQRHDVVLEKDGLQRSIGATIALLKRAQVTIEKAERRIATQGERIRLLEDLNTTDELTGLFNRRGMALALNREIARIRRGHSSSSLLVFIDMENLAAVSEQYSAQAGESCLKLVARILEIETRSMDLAARICESGFALLFSGSPADVALERTQKLALRLNNLSLIRRGREIQINTSIGLKAIGGYDTAEILLAKSEEHDR